MFLKREMLLKLSWLQHVVDMHVVSRSIFLLACSILMYYFVNNMLVPVLLLCLSSLGYNTSTIGIVVLLASLVRIVVMSAVGYIADVLGKLKVLTIGCVVCSLGMLLLLSSNLDLILANRVLLGISAALIVPTLWACGSVLASYTGMHGRLMSVLNVYTNIALLISLLGFSKLFVLLALVLVLIPLVLCLSRIERLSTSAHETSRKVKLGDIVGIFRASKVLLVMCVCALLKCYVLYA